MNISLTHDMLRRFNRDTGWLAAGVLAITISSAYLLAIQVRDHHLETANLEEEATPADLDQVFSRTSSPENSFSQPSVAMPASTPVPAFVEPNRGEAFIKEDFGTSSSRRQSARVSASRVSTLSSAPAKRPRFNKVQMRLIALWHQSLAQSGKSRSWALFSNPNKGDRKKVSYTAESKH
jgi:hypothetical protein